MTVAFLGAAPVDEVARALTDALPPGPPTGGPPSAGLLRAGGSPIVLRVAGGGRFGSVIWAGLSGDVDRLEALRESVRSALTDFSIDERPFRPHLTLSYRSDRAILTALDGYVGPSWQVTDVALVHSENGHYRVVAALPLNSPAGS